MASHLKRPPSRSGMDPFERARKDITGLIQQTQQYKLMLQILKEPRAHFSVEFTDCPSFIVADARDHKTFASCFVDAVVKLHSRHLSRLNIETCSTSEATTVTFKLFS